MKFTLGVVVLALMLLGKVAEAGPNDDVKRRINKGISLAPVIGFDPTYKFLLGGAIFRGTTGSVLSNGSLVIDGSTNGNFEGEAKYTLWDDNHLFFTFSFAGSNFFDAYFGEGDNTSLGSKTQIDLYKFSFGLAAWYRFNHQISTGIYTLLKYREETGVKRFETEFTPVFGVSVQYDSRNNQVDTHSGTFVQLSLDAGPAKLSSRHGATSFARLEADARQFFPLSDSIILAAQARAGYSTGNPSYSYRYTLGGASDLRGYQGNRLRGSQYYLAQLEGRFVLLKWLSVVGFGGGGDTGDRSVEDFKHAKATYGAGIRIGLPPDFVAKARIDFGIAQDEQNFYISFNEAF